MRLPTMPVPGRVLALVGLAAFVGEGWALSTSNKTSGGKPQRHLTAVDATPSDAAHLKAARHGSNHTKGLPETPSKTAAVRSLEPPHAHTHHFQKSKELVENTPHPKANLPRATADPKAALALPAVSGGEAEPQSDHADNSTSAVAVLKLILGVLILGGLAVVSCSKDGTGFIEAVKSGDPASLPPQLLTMGCFFSLVTVQSTAILLFKACQLSGDYSFSPAGSIVFSERTNSRVPNSSSHRAAWASLLLTRPPPHCFQC